jgi:hypothetical protein
MASAFLFYIIQIQNMLKVLNSLIAFILFAGITSCSLVETPDNTDLDYFVADYDMSSLTVTNIFDGPEDKGLIENQEMDEISGLAVSRQNPSLLWGHNDSGNDNNLYLFRNDGTWANTFVLREIENRDWEDLAIGPGPQDGVTYLYLGEIGDNRAQYPVKYIYRFPEPSVTITLHDSPVQNVETITFVYPNEIMMDAETLLLDPWTRDLYIVTKREFPVTVYRLPYPQSTTDTIEAELYGVLPFTMAVGGDVSADGREIIIKSYDRVYLWQRNQGESMAAAFMRRPLRLPYVPEPQGEAIAFTPDGSGYYTLSEIRDGIWPRLYFYRRNK